MRNKAATKAYYIHKLGFQNVGSSDYEGYLMVQKDNIEIFFIEFKEINPKENGVDIHPNGSLEIKPLGQKEFALLDPDNNLFTFGQSL